MDPTCVFNFFTFFERILYKSNCIIFIFTWCASHTKIGSKLVVIVTAGSQKIPLWGPQRTPLGILRVKAANRVPRSDHKSIPATCKDFVTFRIKVSMLPWSKRVCMLNRWYCTYLEVVWHVQHSWGSLCSWRCVAWKTTALLTWLRDILI